MAGSYPDVPGPRMAFDLDGSVGFYHFGSNPTMLNNAQMRSLNNEESDISFVAGGAAYVGIIFPELRDIVGVGFMQGSGGGTITLQSSIDTTNGLDGSWITEVSNIPHHEAAGSWKSYSPYYRTNIYEIVLSDKKAIRFLRSTIGGDTNVYGLHIYGSISDQNLNKLRFWHPTLDQPLDDLSISPNGEYFDWGDVDQGTTQDRLFRIKNESDTLIANNIILSTESLTSASIPDIYTISNGGAFEPTTTISELNPNSISAICTLRKTTPYDANLGLWTVRFIAEAESWS